MLFMKVRAGSEVTWGELEAAKQGRMDGARVPEQA